MATPRVAARSPRLRLSPRARAAGREGGAEARGPAPRDAGRTTAPRPRATRAAPLQQVQRRIRVPALRHTIFATARLPRNATKEPSLRCAAGRGTACHLAVQVWQAVCVHLVDVRAVDRA